MSLNRQSIASAAVNAVADLAGSGHAFVNYEPGNMTRYTLTFTRILPDVEPQRTQVVAGCSNDGAYVMVGYLDHGCYPFELLSGSPLGEVNAGYVQQKLGARYDGDGEALAELFNLIIRHWASTHGVVG